MGYAGLCGSAGSWRGRHIGSGVAMRVWGDVGRDVEDVDLRIVVVVMRLMFGDDSGGYGE